MSQADRPLAQQYGAIELFKDIYNQDNEHIREKIDKFVNLIALSMPAETPDSLEDPEVVRALPVVRGLAEEELRKLVADQGSDVASALRK